MLNFAKIFLSASILIYAATARADVNVAVIAPRVGELKTFGDEVVNGVKIAVDDINSQGGIQGERINLVIVDDRCDDKFAVSTAQMMAVNNTADKMNLVIGPYCQNEFFRVSDIYAQAGILQIIPTGISADETKHNHSGLVKMVGSTDRQGRDFYNYYRLNFDDERVALVYDSAQRNAVEIAAAVQKEFFADNEQAELQSYDLQLYKSDITRLARKIDGRGAKVVYILGEAEEIARLARDLKDENSNIVLFTDRYQAQNDYQEMLGDLAEGSYQIALPSLKNSPNFTETLVRLRLQGAEPEGLGVYGYSAIKLWQDMVEKADSFKYQDVVQILNKTRFVTAWGETMFTNGNPDNIVNYGIYKIQGGEYTQVY